MTILVGEYALTLAALAAAATLVAALAAARFESGDLLRLARWGLGLVALLLTACATALMSAELQSDFRIDYVVHYTERALPWGYKLAAFWAGQEGSLLLWAWFLAGMSVIAVVIQRRQKGVEPAAALAALAGVLGFFVALLLFAANPFISTGVTPADGHGLNPMLQDPGMIAHPPILFLGYAGCTIPFALLIGALAAGRNDNLWIGQLRRWTLVSWLFLSIGILLGAQWAYVELGWGGYWAWDPVENASLLPWLTATAFIHSMMQQQRRGVLKGWNAVLIALTFILCIFGTYITRSGVVDSVHSFGASLVGTFFLCFLVLCTLVSAGVIVWRRNLLKAEHPVESILSREGSVLISNVLLVIMAAATLVGTLLPALSSKVMSQPVSVGKPFYNSVIIPLSLVLLALMAIGPVLTPGKQVTRQLQRRLALPGAIAIVCAMILALTVTMNPYALVCAGLGGAVLGGIAMDLVETLSARLQKTNENPILALLWMLDGNHRRYGGYLVHLGMLLIMAGVAGSSLFATEKSLQLKPGGSGNVGSYLVTLDSLSETKGPNYSAVEASIIVVGPDGQGVTLKPQRRFYEKAENPSTQVAISSTWKQDLYLSLAGWENNGEIVAIQAIINPLVSWIWAGGVVLLVGAVICLLPRVLSHAPEHATAAAPAAAGSDAAHTDLPRKRNTLHHASEATP